MARTTRLKSYYPTPEQERRLIILMEAFNQTGKSATVKFMIDMMYTILKDTKPKSS